MKKNPESGISSKYVLKKDLLILSISMFLMLMGTLNVFAVVPNTQLAKVSMNFANIKAEKVLDEIENQTEFHFIYNEKLVDLSYETIAKYTDQDVFTLLDQLFRGRDIEYKVVETQIVLTKSSKSDAGVAQQVQHSVKGTVIDRFGDPIPGVTVQIDGTTIGTITDMDGGFSLNNISSGAESLVFSFIGMKTVKMPLDGRTTFSITMQEDVIGLDEIVAVGYGTRTRVSLTGSISSISSDEIVTTRNENPENMLAGKISGVRVVQKSAEPGQFNTDFDIRGFGSPLIVVDGVPRDNFSRMDADNIESMSVLKDASAAIYGVRAANGVVLITTKQGSKKEELTLNYKGDFTWQMPSGSPETTTPVEWLTLANELSMHQVNGGRIRYSEDEIELYRSGQKQGTDWHNAIIRSGAPQTKHSLSASGGSEKTHFYSSVGYQNQQSFFRSDALDYSRFNIRSNITSQLTDQLTMSINLNGISEQNSRGYISTENIIHSYQRSNPTQPIYANNTAPYYQEGFVDGTNPVAMMNADVAGDRMYERRWFESAIKLTYDVRSIKGLQAIAFVNYDFNFSDNTFYRRKYDQYNYDDAAQIYRPIMHHAPNKVQREYFSNQSLLYHFALNYNRTFNINHNIEALVLWEENRREGDNFFASREVSLDLPQLFAGDSENQEGNMYTDLNGLYEDANMGLVGRFNYGYRSKYLTEFSFRYDGSSKFGPGHQWGFFPSTSVAWRISEEGFWQNSGLGFINNAKIRGSYGIMGDDRASNYQFVTGYAYPVIAGRNPYELPAGHLFDGQFVNSTASIGIANPLISWYTSRVSNIGFDMDAWRGLFSLAFDYFERDREGLLATRAQSLPLEVGAELPQENLNGDMTRGFDFEIGHRNRINDFNYNVKGVFTLTRTQHTYVERSAAGNSYENWRYNLNDRYTDIWWGQGTAGRFRSYDDIANNAYFAGRATLPGDYRYEDWNGDGRINHLDLHPISFSGTPLINYGITVAAEYKGFDLHMLWQGAFMNYSVYDLSLIQPMWGDPESGALKMFMDRWRPTDPQADPYNPNTKWIEGYYAYTGSTPDRNSYHAINRGDYIRLKSAEVGYSLPRTITSAVNIKSARFSLSGYNLLTFTRMKFLDPEKPGDAAGNLYPLNKTVTIGLDVKF